MKKYREKAFEYRVSSTDAFEIENGMQRVFAGFSRLGHFENYRMYVMPVCVVGIVMESERMSVLGVMCIEEEGTWWVHSEQCIHRLDLFKKKSDWVSAGCYLWLEDGLLGVKREVEL